MRWKVSPKTRGWDHLKPWHPHFFLCPRRIDDQWVWLEWGERRLKQVDYLGDLWFDYRLSDRREHK